MYVSTPLPCTMSLRLVYVSCQPPPKYLGFHLKPLIECNGLSYSTILDVGINYVILYFELAWGL